MKSKLQHFFITLILGILAVTVRAQNATVTLLPTRDNAVEQGPEGTKTLLWLQKQTPRTINLSFHLGALPAGLSAEDFQKCTLRLVAKQVVFQPAGEGDPNTGGTPVSIRGWLADNTASSVPPDAPSILALSILSEQKQPVTMNLKTSREFRDAVFKAYSGNKTISLTLATNSDRASSLFYSTKSFADDPSNIPRLVIEYRQPRPTLLDSLSWPQQQHDPEHTGRNPWIPFRPPEGFTVEKIALPPIAGVAGNPTIVDYPLLYRGDLYLIYHYDSGNYLVCLDFTGRKILWQEKMLEGTHERPVISRLGLLYAVTENVIAAYDLNRNGSMALNYRFGKLSDYTDITAGNDGSLFLAIKQDGLNYINGYSPLLEPFLSAGPFAKEAISTVTVKADGNEIFAQIPEAAVVIDVTDPSKRQRHELRPAGDRFWTPLAGPKDGVMVFSDMSGTVSKGNVRAYATKWIWHSSGTSVPRPVLGANGFVYFVQGGNLQQHMYGKIGRTKIRPDVGLSATSNLVMDGADRIYFWNDGTFYGYKPDGAELFPGKKMESGPEKNIRLMMAPDGTLWANGKTALFAFQPVYTDQDWKVSPSSFVSQTAYRATRNLTVEGGAVPLTDGTTSVLLQAGNSISFSAGFRVPQGASLLCRTGR